MEYEQTLLRDVFKDKMERLQPAWKKTYEQSVDVEQAIFM